jgi:hypothetical protein
MKFSGPKLWSVKLRKMNISDTFFTRSVEAPKLQRPPETIVPSMEKTIAERTAQKWFVHFKQGNFHMSVTLRLGRPCCASGGIWWDMNCLRGICPSLLNTVVNNFAVWRKQSSKIARVDDME